MSTCNRLALQTQGSQPIMPQSLPNHWIAQPDACNRRLDLETCGDFDQQLCPQQFSPDTAPNRMGVFS